MILFMALCLLFAQNNGGASIGGNKGNAQQHNGQDRTPPAQTPTVEPVDKTESPAPANKSDGQQSQTDSKPLSAADKWIIALNTLMVIVFAFQAYIANQQRKIMKVQKEHSEASERAYVGIKQAHLRDYEIGKIPYVRLIALNGGRTPAWKLKAPVTVRIGTEFPLARPELGDVVGSSFLPAGITASYKFSIRFILTPQWKQAIDTGTRKIYLHGEFHYEDCWGKEQIIPFKLFYDHREGYMRAYTDPKYDDPIVSVT